MVKKTFKFLVCILATILLLFQTSAVVLAQIANHEAGATENFGIELIHQSSLLDGSGTMTMGYSVDGVKAYRVYYGNKQYDSTILCLDKNGRFPKAEDSGGRTNQGNYTSLGEATAQNLKTAKSSINNDQATKINWLINNAVLPEDSEEMQKQKISEIFNDIISSTATDINPVTANQIRSVLTQDDIVFALQLAIWNLTNGTTPGTIQGTYDGTYFDSLTGNSIFSYKGVKGAYIKHMYSYYTSHWSDAVTSTGTNPIVSKPETNNTTQELDSLGAFVYVGPFKVDAGTNNYTVDISFKDSEDHEVTKVSYQLTSTNDGKGVIYTPNKAGVNGKEFYVRLRANSNARSVTVKVVPKILSGSAKGYVWTDGVTGDQPLLTIVRNEVTPKPSQKTIKFTTKPRPRLYDAALRKYIVAYIRKDGRNEITKPLAEYHQDQVREPQVARTISKETEYNEYAYLHRKDPWICEVGDTIIYEIKVYNECTESMYITEITDHLPPSGLKLPTSEGGIAINNRYNWVFNSSNNSLTTTETKNTILPGKKSENDTTLSVTRVQIALEVTEEAKGKIITNIAEITGYKTEPIGYEDEDSGFSAEDENHKKATLPSTEYNWQMYQGYQNDADIYTDLDFWYKGQEDDDDFEKITVPDEQFDLALRKSITEVSGTQKAREVKPDSKPLQNKSSTTSTFKDDKSVLKVQVGDKIKYRIRVFNEGNQDGYASKIEDYIPEGLGYLPQSTVNIENGWSVVSKSGDKKLSDIENATSNFNSNDFSNEVTDINNADVVLGKATIRTEKLKNEKLINFESNDNDLDIHSVEVVCVVLDTLEPGTVIKNISAITEYLDKNKQPITPDRDSDTTTSINPDTYPNNDHIQDDDDFEPIEVIKNPKAYDLALKKFITKVTSSNGQVKTLPESQKRYCEVRNTDSLKNREGLAKATADYNLNKKIVNIEDGDTILYTIRLFNEGRTDAKVKEIVDTVPAGLSYIEDSQINRENGWETFNEPTNTGWKTGIRTHKLEETTIPAFDNTQSNGENKEKGLSYRDIQVEFKVELDKVNETTLENIYTNGMKNIAEITDDDGDDNDSTPNNTEEDEDDQDYDIVIPPNPTAFDLALKKFIISINDGETVPARFKGANSDELANGGHDANYNLDKTVIKVKTGKKVVYTIRVFNEGAIDGYVKELRDNLPEGLKFVPRENSTINTKYGWEEKDGQIWTTYLKDELIKAYDSSNRRTNLADQIIDGISYKEVQVELLMTSKDPKKVIVNQAEITEDDNPAKKEDPDSDPNNDKPSEDDQDYDNIIPAAYDLALKKSIATVTDASGKVKTLPESQKRGITVENTDSLKNRGEKADATYDLNKTPVNIADGDSVVYTIRVFNEGSQDAIVKQIVDSIPEGLRFAEYEVDDSGNYESGSKINFKYKWDRLSYIPEMPADKQEKIDRSIYTDYLKDTVIPAFDETQANGENKEKGLSYRDVQIEFIVDLGTLDEDDYATVQKEGIKNIAEITDDDGDDSDSTPDNDNPDEDDEDFDIIIPKEFDLALRKFITKIGDKEITSRIPKVSYTNSKINYSHPKDPLIVVKGQTVIYTIRVYNEGSQNGYASEVTDDLPEGITFLPNNKVNTKYRWKMIDETGKETTDVKKAKKITTDYLSKEQESKSGDNLLKAFNPDEQISDKNPDYRDLEVAFEVTKSDPTVEPKIITNTAEITEDSDEYGNEVEDIDSIPNNGDDEEDDIDVEHIELKYFDLSLLKYVKEVIVTEDGQSKTIKTNYNGLENPEPVVKVELNSKKLSKTEVRYVYTIKITNEGEIEGYAKEITDRIPDGLAFNAEDNTEWKWKVKENGIVTTDYLADKLLKPGESAEVPIVLRWVNNQNNLGQKVNVAEISKDENEYGVPDIDSTPNNNVDGEDDQDNAIVVLAITTGSTPIFMTLIVTLISMIGTGMYLIKKYVL